MAGLLTTLTVQNVIAGGGRAAAQLVEEFSYDGVARADHITGFYIYREGSAELTESANEAR